MISAQPVVFLVDDDASVLKAVSRLLRGSGFDVITYDSSRKFLAHCNPAMHGCVVLDVAMPDLDGLELQEALAARGASLPIIFLTGRGDIPMSVRAMKRGAVDFLTKPVQHRELEAAVRAAIARDREQWRARTELSEIHRRLGTLTPREYEVLEHVVSGQLNKQAGAALGIAEKTVKVHRARVMEKMEVQSVAELVHLAGRAGISGVGATGRIALLDQSPMCPGLAAR
jgi:FixJ family two-component response regulator